MLVSGLFRYPVKSCRGHPVSAAEVEPWGLTGDRRWMVVDPAGEVVTARVANRLVLITPEITDRGLHLSAPGVADLVIDRPEAGPKLTVKIWDDRLLARFAGELAADWFTEVIGRPLRLVYLDDPRRRPVDPDFGAATDVVSFADGFPLLLANQASLDQLNDWIAEGPQSHEGPLPMTRFRPSVVVTGAEPFVEDGWRRVRIGTVDFRVVKPCARCVLTTVDPTTAARSKEPLVSLARHRKRNGKTLFAMNLIPDAPYGNLRIGDPVRVLDQTSVEVS